MICPILLCAFASAFPDQYAPAPTEFAVPTDEQVEAAVKASQQLTWAPVVRPVSTPVLLSPGSSKSYRPTVIAHGMGDSGTNPGMKSLCQTVRAKYPGMFVLCSTTADAGQSITMPFRKQLAAFRGELAAHPELRDGFNAVGLSQGNFLLEAYVALVNDPPVHNFASICGPLQGIGTCPKNLAFQAVCPIWKLDPYGAPLAFSSYWKGTTDKQRYLQKSVLLADVLNERPAKNATVKANWLKLNSLLMAEATQDTMLVPRETELGGMWQWGSAGARAPIVGLRESEGYRGDWVGWKTLDKQGKLRNSTFDGAHIRFSDEWFDEQVLPMLGNFIERKGGAQAGADANANTSATRQRFIHSNSEVYFEDRARRPPTKFYVRQCAMCGVDVCRGLIDVDEAYIFSLKDGPEFECAQLAPAPL